MSSDNGQTGLHGLDFGDGFLAVFCERENLLAMYPHECPKQDDEPDGPCIAAGTGINEWDDSIQAPAPCQPIGCDNGYHLPGCYYAEADRQAADEHRARLDEHAPPAADDEHAAEHQARLAAEEPS